MTFLYCLAYRDPAAQAAAPEERGFFSSPAAADAARRELLTRRRFAERPDGFAIVPFHLDDGAEPAPTVYFGLHYDGPIEGRGQVDDKMSPASGLKTLAVFSTGIKAAEAWVVKMRDPDCARYASCFSITQGTVDQFDQKLVV